MAINRSSVCAKLHNANAANDILQMSSSWSNFLANVIATLPFTSTYEPTSHRWWISSRLLTEHIVGSHQRFLQTPFLKTYFHFVWLKIALNRSGHTIAARRFALGAFHWLIRVLSPCLSTAPQPYANRIIYNSRRIDIHPNTRHQCDATVSWGESVCARFVSDSRCASKIILFHLGCALRPQHRFVSSLHARAMHVLNGASGKKQTNGKLSVVDLRWRRRNALTFRDGRCSRRNTVERIPAPSARREKRTTINFEEKKRNCRFGGCNFRSSSSCIRQKEPNSETRISGIISIQWI